MASWAHPAQLMNMTACHAVAARSSMFRGRSCGRAKWCAVGGSNEGSAPAGVGFRAGILGRGSLGEPVQVAHARPSRALSLACLRRTCRRYGWNDARPTAHAANRLHRGGCEERVRTAYPGQSPGRGLESHPSTAPAGSRPARRASGQGCRDAHPIAPKPRARLPRPPVSADPSSCPCHRA